MTTLVPDPLEGGGIRLFGERLRRGEITSEQATMAYLSRIRALDPALGAFEHVAGESALAIARALDRLLASGTDLGPLMGVPVAVKDLIAVEGMPTTAGSNLDLGDLIGSEGSFVRALKRAGSVILGKTKTVEFAFGVTGVSTPRGTPWNPWDARAQRLPGGSSSGSAVAMAAGLCGFAIGSDTGGSVRVPAALCGVFGLKTTYALWQNDGVFALAPHLDTIGLLTRSAADAAIAFGALTDGPVPRPAALAGLRLGKPEDYFFRNLAPDVARCTDRALDVLRQAGVGVERVDVPEAAERADYFPVVLAASLIAALGHQRFRESRSRMDPIVASRGDKGLEVRAADYIRLETRRSELRRIAEERFAGFDAWVSPTAAIQAPALAELEDPARAMQFTLGMTQNSQPANLMGLCATTTPIQPDGMLPVGLQMTCRAGDDAQALSIALGIEGLVGAPKPARVEAFL